MRIAIIGAGRVGCAIGRALQAAEETVTFIVRHQPVHGCFPWIRVEDMGSDWDLVLIATPDRGIRAVAKSIVGKVNKTAVIGHFSGALGSDCLGTGLSGRFSAHPVYAFPLPGDAAALPQGLIFTLEGDDQGLEMARRLMDLLNARHFIIDAAYKPLYHAACVIAANFTSLNALIASRILRSVGHPWADEMVQALLLSVAGLGPFDEATITGPVTRGDFNIIQSHIRALESKFPVFSSYYKAAVSVLARVLADAGIIEEGQWKKIRQILRDSKERD